MLILPLLKTKLSLSFSETFSAFSKHNVLLLFADIPISLSDVITKKRLRNLDLSLFFSTETGCTCENGDGEARCEDRSLSRVY